MKPECPPEEALIVFARYPGEGAVKKRLEKDLGAEKTLRLYRAFLDDLADKFGAGPRPLVWFYTPSESLFAELFGERFECRPQCGDGLAERMRHAFETLFRDGVRRVVLIGSDIPHMSLAAVEEAFDALKRVDTVLMPSDDGGYTLIGLRSLHDFFSGIPQGTGEVFRATVEKARSQGLSVHCLAATFDVDTLGDVLRLKQLLAESADELPHTRAALAQIHS